MVTRIQKVILRVLRVHESIEERSSEGQVDVGGSEATGEAGSDWETENIMYDAI